MNFGLRRIFRGEEIVKLVFGIDHARVLVTKFLRTLEEILLDRSKNLGCARTQLRHGDQLFRFQWLVATVHHHVARCEVAWANLDAKWDAFLDPFPILYATSKIAAIDVHFDRKIDISTLTQLFREFVASVEYRGACFFLWRDRQNHNLRWRDARRQNNSIIIAVHHHNSANEAGTRAPARGPTEFLFTFSGLKLNAARARKILSEKMRGTGLDRFAVLHHCFDR